MHLYGVLELDKEGGGATFPLRRLVRRTFLRESRSLCESVNTNQNPASLTLLLKLLIVTLRTKKVIIALRA